MYRKNAWENYDGEERARLGAFADAYRAFLDRSKTEREAAASASIDPKWRASILAVCSPMCRMPSA